MTVTINLPPEVQEWLSSKLHSGQFPSADSFIRERLLQDWREEMIEAALQEPAAPLSSTDWAEAHQRLEAAISGRQ
jgi:Arc/MetJ-type ribon-helix-helix transcriptional regulator